MKIILTEENHLIYCSDEIYTELAQHQWRSVQRGQKIFAVSESGTEIPVDGETYAGYEG